MNNKKMWAVLFHLTNNMWGSQKDPWQIEDAVWDKILISASEKGFNTILLDVGDGVCYKSHPEISLEGAWDYERVKTEIKKAKGLGLTIIPKLNFSTIHDAWLGVYERMVSTEAYYQVCKDIITEIYELFEHPKYIHLGMDEESYVMASDLEFVSYRQHELLWHDLAFLFKCVNDMGAKPWIWADVMLEHPEEFRKRFKPEEVILSPWQYFAMYEEHFTPINRTPEDYEYYTTGIFKNSGFVHIEEDPLCVKYREEVIPAMEVGYKIIPTTSNVFNCEYNHDDTLRWFKEKAPDSELLGFLTAPWTKITEKSFNVVDDDMERLMKAKKKYYND